MPKKAAHPSVADQQAAPGGAAAVDRALSLLTAFRKGDGSLTLAELAQRTQLYKSTVLRLIASLEHATLIRRHADGSYSLGPEIVRLHGVYASAFSQQDAVMPVLKELVDQTNESAAFHVRHGDARLCLYRVDSTQLLRDHTRAGDLLPLDRGAGGRVLMAYGGGKEPKYRKIRQDQVVIASGDRVPEVSGISAPVFGADGEFAGAITLSIPTYRLNTDHAEHVREAAIKLTGLLGGVYPEPERS
ncbi:IclR family transcriptional regulator [Pelomonas sp. KK5]|uniref:IclR family transcriptional regulator n=1 Tax=Pelomonas sp. KK5 TaxID=1855730 RepID=UPI00097C1F3A|nr:IclR family transcriptional regulator [Pelomonas sp. KK5]